jgi:hypothetical protein
MQRSLARGVARGTGSELFLAAVRWLLIGHYPEKSCGALAQTLHAATFGEFSRHRMQLVHGSSPENISIADRRLRQPEFRDRWAVEFRDSGQSGDASDGDFNIAAASAAGVSWYILIRTNEINQGI